MSKTVCGVVAALFFIAPAWAAEHEVRLKNGLFEPAYLAIQPGDTVRFVGIDKGHSAETISGMAPEGAKPFKGGISQEIAVSFPLEGTYGIRCLPHFGTGMVALIEVGNASANRDQARQAKLPPPAAKRMAGLFEEAEAARLAAKRP